MVPPSVWLASPRQLEQQHAAPMSTHRFSTKTLVISRPKRQFRPKIISNWVGTGKQTGKTLGLLIKSCVSERENETSSTPLLGSNSYMFQNAPCGLVGPASTGPLHVATPVVIEARQRHLSISFDVTSPGLQLIRLGTAIASEGLGLGSSRFYSPLLPLSSPSFQLPCAALAHRFRRLKQPP